AAGTPTTSPGTRTYGSAGTTPARWCCCREHRRGRAAARRRRHPRPACIRAGAAIHAMTGLARRLFSRRLVVAVPYLWLLLFFLIPFGIVLKIALAEPAIAQPPYTA